MNIIPAILPKSREDLEKKISLLADLVTVVQIDSVDGRFVNPPTWPYIHEAKTQQALKDDIGTLPHQGDIKFEMDLMVENPEAITGVWINAGASRVVIHAESTTSLEKIIKSLEFEYGHTKDFTPGLLSIGIALNIGTELSLIEPYLEYVDYVQFMGIAIIGKQAQPFDKRVLRKISAFKLKYPDIPIQVDGGVSLDTAGVERLIVGSALWNAPDLKEELVKFNELVEMYGIYS
jgi:ribulose-phosphate 3-epimerase